MSLELATHTGSYTFNKLLDLNEVMFFRKNFAKGISVEQKEDVQYEIPIKAGPKTITDIHLKHPTDITVDSQGKIYVVDEQLAQVKIYRSRTDSTLESIIGSGGTGENASQLSYPSGITCGDDDTVFIADQANNRIQIYTPQSLPDALCTIKDTSVTKWDTPFRFPRSIALHPNGSLYISDYLNHRVLAFDSYLSIQTPRELGTFGVHGNTDYTFTLPSGIACDADGNIYVLDSYNNRIQVFNADHKLIRSIYKKGKNMLNTPQGIAVDAKKRIYVTDTYNNRVIVYRSMRGKIDYIIEGSIIHDTIQKFHYPQGIYVDHEGYIYVADSGNGIIQLFEPLRY